MERFGFECEIEGNNGIIVKGTPAILGGLNPSALFRDLESHGLLVDWSRGVEDVIDSSIARWRVTAQFEVVEC